MEGSRMIWLQARIRDEPYNPELGATSGSAGRDAILPISLGMVPEDHTVNDLAALIVKRFDAVHPDKGKLKVRYLQTEYGALMSVLDPVGMHFPRRNGQEPDKPFTVLAIRFPPLPDELHNFARFTSVAPESSARPYKRLRDDLQYAAAANRYGHANLSHGNWSANKRQRMTNGEVEGLFDPDQPIRSRERDLPTIDADTYRSTGQDASNYVVADSQRSPRRNHTNTYGTPKSLSTASLTANATHRLQGTASVPDSPTYRGTSPIARALQGAQISQDAPKSESPEQDNIVYSIPPSNPSTPRGDTQPRAEELPIPGPFLKPSLPAKKTATPVPEISNAVPSTKKKLFADRYRTPEGPRADFVGKNKLAAQHSLGGLSSAFSNGRKAFSNHKAPKNIWDVVESDEEGSCRANPMHSARRSKQQAPTAMDTLPEPRLFSRFNGTSPRSPSASRNIFDDTKPRRDPTTDLTNPENLSLNRSISKTSDAALDDQSVAKDNAPRAVHSSLEEATMEGSLPLGRDVSQPTDFVADLLQGSDSNDQEMHDEATSEQGRDKYPRAVKPTVEHGMDVDVEMNLNDEHEGPETSSSSKAKNTESHTEKGMNDDQEVVENGADAMIIEDSSPGQTWTTASVTKQTPSTKAVARNEGQKKTKEEIAVEAKAKKAHKQELEREERVRKAHELEERQRSEAFGKNEKFCTGTPAAAARCQPKSITSPFPGPNQRRSALKPSTSIRSSSISSRGTPPRSMTTDTQTPVRSTLQPSPVVVSHSVSFADDPEIVSGTKGVKASGKSKKSIKDVSKSVKSVDIVAKAPGNSVEPAVIKTESQERREQIRNILADRKAKSRETEREKMEHTTAAQVTMKPVKGKSGTTKSETIQTELKVIRDKGKKPIYDPPSPPKAIVSHTAKEQGTDGANLSEIALSLGNRPGPSKSRSTSAIAPSKPKEEMTTKWPSTLMEAPKLIQTPCIRSMSEGEKAAEPLSRNAPLSSKSASRSPAREVVSSDSSQSGSDSDSDSHSDSESGSEDVDKDAAKEEVNDVVRNVKSPTANSVNGSTKATHQTNSAAPAPISAGTVSESESEFDDGGLPPIKLQSESKSPSESDSQSDDEVDLPTRRSLSSRDETASRSASIMDEAERQLQRENRQSMEPSRSSQMHPPPKTPKMAGLPVAAQQAKTKNVLSSVSRFPNQRLHSLSSIINGTSTSMTAGKKLPAYKQPSMKTAVEPTPKGRIDPIPVTRPGNADSQSSSEDDDDSDSDSDSDDDDTDDRKKGSAGRGFDGLMKRKL
ncbi:hypothetical protein MMC18_004008 [Xylographa bjoerkii]|nr:hypothetical protein [Xylographa bjoerkii]